MASLFARRVFAALPKAKPAFRAPVRTAPRAIFSAIPRARFYSDAIPKELKYTEEHEWVRTESDGTYTIGVTDKAQKDLGDIVFVELPEVGTKVAVGESVGTIESVKAVAEIYSPLSGEVLEVNEALGAEPEQLNEDAYGEGWLVKIQASDRAEVDNLLTADKYEEFVAQDE